MNNPWFQLVASVISMVMIANLQYAWTLFVTPIQDAMGWKLAEVQLAFTIFINLQTFVQPIDGWFIDRMGVRADAPLTDADLEGLPFPREVWS